MMKHYAFLIRPISLVAHLIILNGLVFYYFNEIDLRKIFYFNFTWLITALFSKIYHFTRTIKVTMVVKQLMVHFAIFTLSYLAYFTVSYQIYHAWLSFKFLGFLFIGVTIYRIIYFWLLRQYRLVGKNFKRVILVGSSKSLSSISNFMINRSDFGFKIVGFFSDDDTTEFPYKIHNQLLSKESVGKLKYLGCLDDISHYIQDTKVDQIYCSLTEISVDTINKIIDMADKAFIQVKLVPNPEDKITRKLNLDYHGVIPVFKLRNLPLEDPISKFSKRVFDILFSLTVIVFIMSWLVPILFVIVKLESKGPLFFKQIREGYRGRSFMCYKFRSMHINDRANIDQTTRNDRRITRVGRFIRKTSIDELPQFFNVLLGDMSIVGPRPHMPKQSLGFKKVVDNYMLRHFVKPGITGLAQVRGYRGEIETDDDIKGRVYYDLFYIENWSFILDLNIVIKTTLNVLQGDENAY